MNHSSILHLKSLNKSKSSDNIEISDDFSNTDDDVALKKRRIAATLAGHAISESYKKATTCKNTNEIKTTNNSKKPIPSLNYCQNKLKPSKQTLKQLSLNANLANSKIRRSTQDKIPSKIKKNLKPFASSPIKGSINMLVTNSIELDNSQNTHDSTTSFVFNTSNPPQIKTMLSMDFRKSESTGGTVYSNSTITNSSYSTLIDVNTSITLYPSQNNSQAGVSSSSSVLVDSSFTSINTSAPSQPNRKSNPSLDNSFAYNQPEDEWFDLDAEDKDDPLMVSEYISDIISYLLSNEEKTMPLPNYIAKQPEITWSMRELLVTWVIRVHYHMMMLPETLFLAVNLIDRFLSIRFVASSKFQLVGIVALLIASKYEEMNTRSIKDFLSCADNAFCEEDVLAAERFMLRVLDFDISFSGPLTFLRRTSKADGYNLQNRTVAKYFLEISLVDNTFLFFKPSLIAASSIYLARKIFGSGKWDASMCHYSNYSESQLIPCVNSLINHLAKPDNNSVIDEKYSQRCFYYASIVSRKWAASHFSSFSKFSSVNNPDFKNPFNSENKQSSSYSDRSNSNVTPLVTKKRSISSSSRSESPIPDDASDTTIV
ncbi:G2/mitotic-specific cyclin cdc13 [Smittium culicis]|uniref:G2/mitotic-specific cyclin cdc13 n=1 Tax=Smittium culicis TaxID=133412 RepID=A0A1R1WXX5_9FUNG|nr:G2/mitotic-specific cyclin cdc13 [Smittium culicis]